jgi:transketolase
MAERIRRIILEQSRRAHVGHIGSALSIADLVAALYGGVLPQDRAYQTWSSPVAS